MPPKDDEKLNRVEELQRKLSSTAFRVKSGSSLDALSPRPKKDVADSWKTTEENAALRKKLLRKKSVFRKFFIFSIIFFVLALGYAAYMYFAGGNTVSNDNIDISVLGNTFTTGGEDFPMVIGVTNKNSSALENVDLIVEYPKGATSDSTQGTERFRQSVGTIAAGATHNESLKIVLFGQEGDIRTIKISIEYRVQGSNAIFVKDKPFEITIKSSPINLTLDAPDNVSPNQNITLNIEETLNATKPAAKILVKVDYPFGFQFISASPKPTYDNDVWDLGDLAPGVAHDISITGKMVDVFEGEQKSFHVTTGSVSAADRSLIGVVFNIIDHVVAIQRPFIEARLFVNGVYQSQYASDSKTQIEGQIQWVNNLDTKLNDVQIVAKISGNAVDERTINAHGGFYNSVDNSITWDKNFLSKFAQINPGDAGSVDFLFAPLSSVGGLSDPSIKIDVSISGKQPLEGNATKELKNSESKVIKIISETGLATKALYYSGPFQNTGPIPPIAEEETTYTVVWTLSNTSNSISGAKVTSSLPPWVRFAGAISPSNESLVYDSGSQQLSWNIGSIPKGTGTTGATREVSFQVSLTPSLSQVNTQPTLVNGAVLTGHDDFANVDITVKRPPIGTYLINDPAFPAGGANVKDPGTH